MNVDYIGAAWTPEGYLRRYDYPDNSTPHPEPICPICEKPIQWCLDMFSFTTGFDAHPFTLAHAHCVWKKEAFTRERLLAPTKEDN